MTFSLVVENRAERGKKLNALRNAGKLPAVLYGPKEAETTALTIDKKAFNILLKDAGESSLITLTGLSVPKDVLIQDVAFDAERGGVTHVDFYAVEADKEITVHIQLEFIGEAPAVKLGGTLTKVLHEIEVSCLPKNLPQHISVDVTALVDFEKQIHVSDLAIPDGVTLKTDKEDVVALVQAVKDEVIAEVAQVDMSAIEVEKKGKDEEATASAEAQ